MNHLLKVSIMLICSIVHYQFCFAQSDSCFMRIEYDSDDSNYVLYFNLSKNGYDNFFDETILYECSIKFEKDSTLFYDTGIDGYLRYFIKDGLIYKIRSDYGESLYYYDKGHLTKEHYYPFNNDPNYEANTDFVWKGDSLLRIEYMHAFDKKLEVTYFNYDNTLNPSYDYKAMYEANIFHGPDIPLMIMGYWGVMPKYSECTITFTDNHRSVKVRRVEPKNDECQSYHVESRLSADTCWLPVVHTEKMYINKELIEKRFGRMLKNR